MSGPLHLPIASFNYYPPSLGVIAAAVVLGLLAVGVISVTLSPGRAFLAGGAALALIGFYAALSGSGDMAGLQAMMLGILGGVSGAVISCIASAVIRATRRRE